MASKRIERCCECDEPTGRAGRLDDSLFTDDGEGPFCESCFGKKRPVENSVAVQCEDTRLDMFSELADSVFHQADISEEEVPRCGC